MKSETAQKPYRLLQLENRRLRERLAELERKLQSEQGASGSHQLSKGDSRLFELVKKKDKALSEYAERMEQKARELEAMVTQVNRRNEELANGMAVLRLYQLMFENEPAGIVGIDRDGRVIQFNSAAVRYFGVGLHALRLQHLSGLVLPGSDLDFEELFEAAVDADEDVVVDSTCEQGPVNVRAYRLDDPTGLRGVVIRVFQKGQCGES